MFSAFFSLCLFNKITRGFISLLIFFTVVLLVFSMPDVIFKNKYIVGVAHVCCLYMQNVLVGANDKVG